MKIAWEYGKTDAYHINLDAKLGIMYGLGKTLSPR